MIYAPRPGDEADADEALLFVYDGWNRLVKVYKDDGESQGVIDESDTLGATYEYDGLGRRIQKTVGETTDDYYYNESWQVLEVRRGGDPDPLDQYVWDVRYVDAPAVRFHDGNTDGDYLDAGDNVLYYTTDANWNVTALVDAATGDVVERYMYDAYGKATVLNGANGTDPDVNGSTVFEWDVDADGLSDVANDVLFAGYRFDAETGLYHVRNRQYHPTLGRWIERDPAGYVDGVSLYEYAGANPGRYRDPNGLDFWGDAQSAAEFGENVVGGFLEGAAFIDLPPPADQNAANGRNVGRGAAAGAGAYLAVKGAFDVAGGGPALLTGAALMLAGAGAGGGAGTAVQPGGGTVAGAAAGAVPGAALVKAGAIKCLAGVLEFWLGYLILHRTANLGPATPPKPQSTPPTTQNACEGSSLAPKRPTSPNQMQEQVRKGQAPRQVKRVEGGHVPGQQPHVHYKDGSASNMDGTPHDAGKGTPDPNGTTREWLEKNGWTPPPRY